MAAIALYDLRQVEMRLKFRAIACAALILWLGNEGAGWSREVWQQPQDAGGNPLTNLPAPSGSGAPVINSGHLSTSVLCNATGSTGVLADCQAGADGYVLQRSGGVLTWGPLSGASVTGTPNTAAYFNGSGILNSLTLAPEFTLSTGTLSLTANGVLNAKLATMPALSAKVNATNATAAPQDLVGSAGFLGVNPAATALSFRPVDVSSSDIVNRLAATNFPALSGAVTTPGGSLVSSFGAQSGPSLFGVASGSSAVPAPVVASGTNTVPTYNGTSIAWSPVTPATAGIYGTWASTRVAAIAPSGSDSNHCWADSPDGTQANVATALATASATPCASHAGLLVQLPPAATKGQSLYVFRLGGGNTYDSSSALVNGLTGYGQIAVLGTGTVASCGSIAFSWSTADSICQGAVTAPGMNAAGYSPPSSSTSQTITFALVGGGSPGWPAEPAAPDYYRFRWDANTTTVALRNKVQSIIAVPASNQLTLDASVTYASTDVGYIEMPGVNEPGATFTGSGGGGFYAEGVNYTGFVLFTATYQPVWAFDRFASGVQLIGASSQFIATAGVVSPFSTVGPSVILSTLTITSPTGSSFISNNSLGVYGAATFVNVPSSIGRCDSLLFGGNVKFTGGAGPVDHTAAISQQYFGGDTFNPGPPITTTDRSVRILGNLTLDGTTQTFGSIRLPSTTQAYGVVLKGTNDVSFVGAPQGGTKTDAGFSVWQSVNSRISFMGYFGGVAGTFSPTLTGANGDVYLGNANTYGANAYVGWNDMSGSYPSPIHLPNGDTWVAGYPPSSGQNTSTSGMATVYALIAQNDSGSDIPSGRVVRMQGPGGDHAEVAIAQADTFAHSIGPLGVSISTIKNGKAGLVATTGAVGITWSDVSGGGPGAGGVTAYLSDTVAGEVRSTPPSGGSTVVRVLGWSNDENALLLHPDNYSIGGGLAIGGSFTIGFTTFTGGVLQRDALTGAITSGVGSTSTAFGAAPSLSALINATNASAVPSYLQCTGAGQVFQDTGTAIACAALTLGMEAAPSGTGLAGVSSGAWASSAVSVDSTMTLSGGVLGRAAISGDGSISAGSNTFALSNIPNGTTAAGDILHTSIAAPATPAAGKVAVYTDSTSKNFAAKNESGTVNHGAQTFTASSHQFATALSDAGAWTTAQPSYSDISGSVPAITSLTGDVTGSGTGAVATTISANAVTNADIRQSTALSVIGRSANSAGNVADISATASSGAVLRESGSTIGFGNITEGAVTNLTTDLAGKVPTTRNINTTAPMTGGGTLASDLTLAVPTFVASGSSHASGLVPDPGSTAGTTRFLREDATWQAVSGGGGGTVTTVTGTAPIVITSTPTTTPNVTIQGAIVSGSTSTTAQNLGSLTTGLLKGTVSGGVNTLSTAVSGTDYQAPLTAGTGITISGTTISSNISTGVSGGQTIWGGTASGDHLAIGSTTNATKGYIQLGITPQIVVNEATGATSIGSAALTTDSRLHVQLDDDTTPSTISTWGGRHFVAGATGSTGLGMGVSKTASTSTVNVSFITPGVAWANARVQGNSAAFYVDAGAVNVLNLTSTGGIQAPQLVGPGPVQADASGNLSVANQAMLAYGISQAFGGGDTIGLPTSSPQGIGTQFEYPIGFAASSATLNCNVITNGQGGGDTMAVKLTKNGTAVGTFFTLASGSGTGLFTGFFALSSTASTDTFGLQIVQTGDSSTNVFACNLQISQ